jgi:hypothetical protein
LFLAFSHQFSQKSLPVIKEKRKVKPIQARLYFPPVKKQLTVKVEIEVEVEVEVEVEQAKPPIKRSKPTTEKTMVNKLADKVTPPPIANKKSPVIRTQQIAKKVLTSNSSTKNISQSALEKLQQRLSNQALEDSSNDSFNQYLSDKNYIAPSITKFNQLPEAKAKIKKVDCDASALNTVIVITSGLLGGSVRCDSMPNLKEFLDKRAEEKR